MADKVLDIGRDVLDFEIFFALKDINENNALRLDGFNSIFFIQRNDIFGAQC